MAQTNKQGGDVPTGLDEAVRMFKGYVRGENGFDELDFKEWLIEWREQEIAEAREPYNELIMLVGNKFRHETRHETAMRYIIEAENQNSPPSQALRTKAPSQLKGEKE